MRTRTRYRPGDYLKWLRTNAHMKSLLRVRDGEPGVRGYSADTLGAIEDDRAIKALLQALHNDTRDWVRDYAAISLAHFDDGAIDDALEKAADKCIGAVLALAWKRGGDYLQKG